MGKVIDLTPDPTADPPVLPIALPRRTPSSGFVRYGVIGSETPATGGSETPATLWSGPTLEWANDHLPGGNQTDVPTAAAGAGAGSGRVSVQEYCHADGDEAEKKAKAAARAVAVAKKKAPSRPMKDRPIEEDLWKNYKGPSLRHHAPPFAHSSTKLQKMRAFVLLRCNAERIGLWPDD